MKPYLGLLRMTRPKESIQIRVIPEYQKKGTFSRVPFLSVASRRSVDFQLLDCWFKDFGLLDWDIDSEESVLV